MLADDTALVLVLPGDTTDLVLQKVLQAGANRVQLLVPEGVTALQRVEGTARLRQAADRGGIDLILISSDLATITAARRSNLETMLVSDARVLAPPPAGPPPSPYATRVLEREPRDAAPGNLADDLNAGDAAFLHALDDLDVAPGARPGPASSADDDIFAALESISAAIDQPPRPPRPASPDDDLAAALDSIGSETIRAPQAAPPPRRVRPEDIELTDAERQRAAGNARQEAGGRGDRGIRGQGDKGMAGAQPAGGRWPAAAPRPASPPAPYPDEAARPARRPWLVPALIVLLLLLLLGIGAVLVFGSSATVTVSAPLRPETTEPVERLPVPLADPAGPPSSTAVSAAPFTSEVAVRYEAEVTETTQAPAGTAGGQIELRNSAAQPFLLPVGTEFIAVKSDGQEVPFISTQEVLVPGATTRDDGTNIITSRGQATVPVSARSPGSTSNVDANTIRRVSIPGGGSFGVESGGLIVNHGPLTGGSEEEVRIVKDSDVQRALGAALLQLDEESRVILSGLASAQGLSLEPTTIFPRRADLERLQGFEYSVTPPVGETLDPNNPRFTITVQARYGALATPPDRPLVRQGGGGQLADVFVEQLLQAGLLRAGDCKAPAISNWSWDGAALFVDGRIGPNPACGGGLAPGVPERVREAVRGKTRAEAEAALQALVDEGLISGYQLPDLQRLPGMDWQITVREG